MKKQTIKRNALVCFMMGFSFLLWSFLFRNFFLLKAAMDHDGKAYYRMNVLFWENMVRGVYPMWEYYRDWGFSFGSDIRFIGEFNPYHLVPIILLKIGLPIHLTYFFYAYTYYFVGVIGFFLVSKRIVKDVNYAFICSIIYLFSSLGINIFFNYCEVVISVCAVWFFYFFVRFFSDYDKASFVGLTFSMMIIMITYMPFHFLTIFLVAILFYFVIKPKKTWEHLRMFVSFAVRHKLLVLFCVISVLIATIPGAIWYFSAKTGNFIVNYRQLGTSGESAAMVGKSVVSAGGLLGPLTFENLFSGFSYIKHQVSYFSLSVFCYLILGLSLVNRATKNQIIYFCVSLLMFLISLTYVSGIHGFLYDHIYFFKLYRNVYYLLQMALPFIILFIVTQLKSFLEIKMESKTIRVMYLLFNMLIHGLFVVFLKGMDNIIVTSYITTFCSYIFFSLIIIGFIKRDGIVFSLMLYLLVILQPVEVFTHYSSNLSERKVYKTNILKRPVFYYKRLESGEVQHIEKDAYADFNGMRKRGFYKYAGVPWREQLLRNIDFNVLQDYVRNKFIIYDQVRGIGKGYIDWALFEKILKNKRNVALISDDNKELQSGTKTRISHTYQVVEKNSDEFEVVEFDVNYIKIQTNFSSRRFLVYNDNFHSFWRVFQNGKKQKLYRTNLSFKGVWIEPGENVTVFKYGTGLHHFAIWGCFVLFYSMFGYCVFLHCKKRNKNEYV